MTDLLRCNINCCNAAMPALHVLFADMLKLRLKNDYRWI